MADHCLLPGSWQHQVPVLRLMVYGVLVPLVQFVGFCVSIIKRVRHLSPNQKMIHPLDTGSRTRTTVHKNTRESSIDFSDTFYKTQASIKEIP
jgi:hypothetical protein